MILYCVVSRLEITKIRDAHYDHRPAAFVSVFDISEATRAFSGEEPRIREKKLDIIGESAVLTYLHICYYIK